jgi:hypothetical protein
MLIHYHRPAWDIGDLSFFCFVVRIVAMRIVVPGVMSRAVFGDQASAFDAPVILSKDRIRDRFPDPHNR